MPAPKPAHRLSLVALLAGLCLAGAAGAMVYGGSNLSYFGYPEHTCRKPYKPYSFTTQSEVDSYNYDLERFVDCVQEYVDNADSDIKRIRERVDEAIADVQAL